ncbi:hypothetical protein [Sphingomonas sp. 3-13AW]|uniref:hypothetical protein n=1 Tax=Sphingomonas sp. 3-13AW TaxID=3050450 RepID=UPI003BB58361
MFEGHFCRRLSAKNDQNLQREMGAMSRAAFIEHWLKDAANPDQIDALAFQLLCLARRCKTSGIPSAAKEWKAGWQRLTAIAAAARERIASLPSRTSSPELFNPRSVGKPGCLDSDLFLPLSARLNLAGSGYEQVPVGVYEAPLVDGATYDIGRSRLGYTWVTRRGTGTVSKVPNCTLRGLYSLGRLDPVEPEAAREAA